MRKPFIRNACRGSTKNNMARSFVFVKYSNQKIVKIDKNGIYSIEVRMEIVNNFLWLFEIVGEATAGAGDHIMRATFTRLVGRGFESVAQELSMHFFDR